LKKGINHWAFPAGMPVEEVIGLAAQYGFQGIELCPRKREKFRSTREKKNGRKLEL